MFPPSKSLFGWKAKRPWATRSPSNWGGEIPQGIIYPTGGGVGLIGMWKAFDELETLGWIGSERPRMVTVQATGCAPIVKAWDEGKSHVGNVGERCHLRCRAARSQGLWRLSDSGYFAEKSNGIAVAVSDEEIMDALRQWARVEGVFAAPEGAAALAAYRKLRSSRFFKESDEVVLFNTGTGLKYLDTLDTKRVQPTGLPTSRQIAGIIGPY